MAKKNNKRKPNPEIYCEGLDFIGFHVIVEEIIDTDHKMGIRNTLVKTSCKYCNNFDVVWQTKKYDPFVLITDLVVDETINFN